MNISSVLNIGRPVSLYEKEKDKKDTSFMDILAQTTKETQTTQKASEKVTEDTTNSAEEVQAAIEAEIRDKYHPSYTLTDEEIEYFREKYGEDFDEEKVRDFFYELAEKGIIHEFDAMATTRMGYIQKVEIIGDVPPGGDFWKLWEMGEVMIIAGKKIWGEGRFGQYEYDEFKRDYTKMVETWEDYVQEQYDYYEFLKSVGVIRQKDGVIPNTYDWSEKQSRVEKTAEIIKQIFG